MRLRRLAIVLWLAVLAGCAQFVPAPAGRIAVDPPLAWANVLSRHVDDAGRVDYRALGAARSELDGYVAWIYAVGPASRPALFPTRAHELAYHLNAYNALAMYSVLDAGEPASLADYGLLRFFWLRRLRVAGETMSLYDYENAVIRRFGDARVHFALNCMALGCPRLPRTPFHADALDRQLEREARIFLNDERNVRVDAASRTVALSELLDWYRDDFLREADSLQAYVNRYRATPLPAQFRVEFTPYDWRTNARR